MYFKLFNLNIIYFIIKEESGFPEELSTESFPKSPKVLKMSSDDEYEHIGNQVLPVANLPKNFNDDPIDGAEYLFTVR